MPERTDHPILDLIEAALSTAAGLIFDVAREPGRVEFTDVETGKRYEVAVVAVGPAPGAIRRYERCRACRGCDERCATCGGEGYVPIGDYRRGRSRED